MARHELWVELADRPGNLAALAGELAACDANIVHLDIHPGTGETVVDRLVVDAPDRRSADLAGVARRSGATLRRLHDGARAAPPGGDDDGDDPGGDEFADRSTAVAAAVATASHPANAGMRPRRTPMTLERLVALGDGGLVRLRHLSSGDRDALVAHHERCSPATRRHSRFLVPGLLPARPPIRDTLVPRRCDHVALAALSGGEIIGAGRYDVAEGGTLATVAVIIEDGHQRRGIGSLLVGELAVLASNAEVGRLRAVAPAAGDALAATLRRAGLTFTTRRDGASLVFDCGLPDGLSASA
jgi:hypothetical protein